MTAVQKTFLALVVTAAIGTGGYASHQTFRLRERAQTLRQEQARLVEHIQQLQYEREEATNRLASLLVENQGLESNADVAEIQRLQAEVTRLQAAKAQRSDSNAPVLDSWLNRVNRLKQFVEQHPDQTIPEFKFLTNREWLLSAASDRPVSDWGAVLQNLKMGAVPRFAEAVQQVLKRYAQANGGKFPHDLSQLQPYCDTEVEDILQQRYEIKPASVLPARSVKDKDIKTDWVIAGKEPVASNTGNHIAIYAGGYTYFW